ncbi:MAG: PspC domain-containing protein [Elusimicrobiaceae bacterium]|jgi:phage shock protein C|nr:PspC domain-containing protein [Elusimicrobiaceae bacterium]MBT3955188.1 PspC domain-containing protein [Elusimicrobiaceae bacterium]MBT4008011.1 PspC domain-containing protein [Elusimicrobiaceae bacterium]MBT4402803.1 PspC domain-containing protein [Elusimicrobiaceae bacterium]MBT4439819.1 PspC domain-containing protein [Elusimicrobiaceae bacterium]
MEHKKLKRSSKNYIVFGILGGLGEYLNIDPVLLRLIFVVLMVLTGFIPFIVIYILAYFIIPADNTNKTHE